jgi:hypothetical protein
MPPVSDSTSPKGTAALCLDFKLFAAWQMSLMLAGVFARDHAFDIIDDRMFYGALAVWFVALVSAAVLHRRGRNWRWPELTDDSIKHALLVGGVGGALLVLFSSHAPAMTRASATTAIFACSLVAFALLYALKIAQWDQNQFAACCGEPAPPADLDSDNDNEPGWKRFARGTYLTLLPLVVLEGIAAIVVDVWVKQQASPWRTATHTMMLLDHRTKLWLTPGQWNLFHAFMQPLDYSVPVLVIGGLFLNHVLDVKLFPGLKGMFARGEQS